MCDRSAAIGELSTMPILESNPCYFLRLLVLRRRLRDGLRVRKMGG